MVEKIVNEIVSFVQDAASQARRFVLAQRVWLLGFTTALLGVLGYLGVAPATQSAFLSQLDKFVDAGLAWVAATELLIITAGPLILYAVQIAATVKSISERPLGEYYK